MSNTDESNVTWSRCKIKYPRTGALSWYIRAKFSVLMGRYWCNHPYTAHPICTGYYYVNICALMFENRKVRQNGRYTLHTHKLYTYFVYLHIIYFVWHSDALMLLLLYIQIHRWRHVVFYSFLCSYIVTWFILSLYNVALQLHEFVLPWPCLYFMWCSSSTNYKIYNCSTRANGEYR